VFDGLTALSAREELEDDAALAPLHPRAEELVPDSALWDLTEDYSPIGNDTGADVFQLYRRWRREHGELNRALFFRELMARWQVRFGGPEATSGPAVQKVLEKDYYPLLTWDDAIIAWVMSPLLVDGNASLGDMNFARVAIDRQSTPEVMSFRRWRDPSVRLDYLGRVRSVIEAARERHLGPGSRRPQGSG